jgi:hypothetical protein
LHFSTHHAQKPLQDFQVHLSHKNSPIKQNHQESTCDEKYHFAAVYGHIVLVQKELQEQAA